MSSRFPSTKVLDYCYNPVRLVVDNSVVFVPCGKCDGCLLHKANEWSIRLGSEIEDNVLSIFFTLTYNNKYLPTMVQNDRDVYSNLELFWTSYHDRNIRFNGKEDVLREEIFEGLYMPYTFTGIRATNYKSDELYFPYSSKRDFQLYLKLIRKDLYEKFKEGFFCEVETEEDLRFRYYAISEYGETLLRPHVHAVILPRHPEVANYLCYQGLFKSWQMCDMSMFQQHCHFADSGCRGYITQYLTCNSRLPQVYKDHRIKPWRLSSKGSAIGYNGFDKEKVCQDFSIGIDEYCKVISRLDEQHILRYPKAFGTRLFPKCYEFRKKDFHGLYGLYSIYWRFKRYGEESACNRVFIDRFLSTANPADIQAVKACWKVCEMMHWHPHTYVYTLDMFYYKNAMSALRYWYRFQESTSDKYAIIKSYTNFSDYRQKFDSDTLEDNERLVFEWFLSSFGLDVYDIIWSDFDVFLSRVSSDYTGEVSDILTDMVKMPKFNEKFGISPNSDCNF